MPSLTVRTLNESVAYVLLQTNIMRALSISERFAPDKAHMGELTFPELGEHVEDSLSSLVSLISPSCTRTAS